MAGLSRRWVIVDGNQPTSFHAREAEELVPTLKQLQRTQPQVALMWFERGRLWPSPEAARQAMRDRQDRRRDRGPDWRPGGEHRDPKARPDIPRDVRRARFKKRLIERASQDGPRGGAGGSRGPRSGEAAGSERPPQARGRSPRSHDALGRDRQPDARGSAARPNADRDDRARSTGHRPQGNRDGGSGTPKEHRLRGGSDNFGRKTKKWTSDRDGKGERPGQGSPRGSHSVRSPGHKTNRKPK